MAKTRAQEQGYDPKEYLDFIGPFPLGCNSGIEPLLLEKQQLSWAVNVTVRGPELMLAKLNLRDAAYIDADGMVPGDYDSAIQVTLPDGIELVHQSAMRVRLRLYREKRIIRP